MLAVKLHTKKKPWLGKGSYLVPIISWETGRIQVQNWIKFFEHCCRHRRGPNTRIRYVTLVKIPKDHPVRMFGDWDEKLFVNPKFEPFSQQPRCLKDLIGSRKAATALATSTITAVGETSDYAELQLGEALPGSCIKWTKDARLLYRKA